MNRNINVKWIDVQAYSRASRIASGLYNPVVLKRMRMVHMAETFIAAIEPFYRDLESFTKTRFFYPSPIYRLLHNAAEQNNWYNLKDNRRWASTLGDIITNDKIMGADFGLGTVKQTGWVNTAAMIEAFRKTVKKNIIEEPFYPKKIEQVNTGIKYNGIHYDAIVFAEGWRAAEKNPYYPKDVFRPSKGELLTVKLDPKQAPDIILHYKHFLIPLNDTGMYRTGATYVHGDLSDEPTVNSKKEMLQSLKQVYGGSIDVINHDVGVRAATKDRRPIIGQHPLYSNIYFMNGLGSRSILMSPYLTEALSDKMCNQKDIEPSIDINRFF